MGEIPGVGEHVGVDGQAAADGPGEGHVAQRPGGVVAGDRLHGHARGAGVDDGRDGLTVAVDGDDHEQVRAGSVRHPRHRPVDGHLIAGDLRAGGGGAVEARSRGRPSTRLAARWAGAPARRPAAGRPPPPPPATRRRRHRGSQWRAAAPAPGRRPAPGRTPRPPAARRNRPARRRRAPRRQHPGPAGLHRERPQVGQCGRVLQRRASGLDRLDPRERPPSGLAQQLLFVGQGEVHDFTACFSIERNSLNGTPLSSRGSGGRPSTRSPIVLRSTCSVPPADFRPGRNEIR